VCVFFVIVVGLEEEKRMVLVLGLCPWPAGRHIILLYCLHDLCSNLGDSDVVVTYTSLD
jgi:hypothetical protein